MGGSCSKDTSQNDGTNSLIEKKANATAQNPLVSQKKFSHQPQVTIEVPTAQKTAEKPSLREVIEGIFQSPAVTSPTINLGKHSTPRKNYFHVDENFTAIEKAIAANSSMVTEEADSDCAAILTLCLEDLREAMSASSSNNSSISQSNQFNTLTLLSDFSGDTSWLFNDHERLLIDVHELIEKRIHQRHARWITTIVSSCKNTKGNWDNLEKMLNFPLKLQCPNEPNGVATKLNLRLIEGNAQTYQLKFAVTFTRQRADKKTEPALQAEQTVSIHHILRSNVSSQLSNPLALSFKKEPARIQNRNIISVFITNDHYVDSEIKISQAEADFVSRLMSDANNGAYLPSQYNGFYLTYVDGANPNIDEKHTLTRNYIKLENVIYYWKEQINSYLTPQENYLCLYSACTKEPILAYTSHQKKIALDLLSKRITKKPKNPFSLFLERSKKTRNISIIDNKMSPSMIYLYDEASFNATSIERTSIPSEETFFYFVENTYKPLSEILEYCELYLLSDLKKLPAIFIDYLKSLETGQLSETQTKYQHNNIACETVLVDAKNFSQVLLGDLDNYTLLSKTNADLNRLAIQTVLNAIFEKLPENVRIIGLKVSRFLTEKINIDDQKYLKLDFFKIALTCFIKNTPRKDLQEAAILIFHHLSILKDALNDNIFSIFFNHIGKELNLHSNYNAIKNLIKGLNFLENILKNISIEACKEFLEKIKSSPSLGNTLNEMAETKFSPPEDLFSFIENLNIISEIVSTYAELKKTQDELDISKQFNGRIIQLIEEKKPTLANLEKKELRTLVQKINSEKMNLQAFFCFSQRNNRNSDTPLSSPRYGNH